MVPAQERLVLPDVGLDSGIAPAFGQHPPDGPQQARLDPQGERETGEDLVGHFFRLCGTQERRLVHVRGFPGQDGPEPGELTAAAVGMAGHQGEHALTFAWKRRPHSSHIRTS